MDDYLPADAGALMARIREGLCDPRIRAWVLALAQAVLDEQPIPVGEATEVNQGA